MVRREFIVAVLVALVAGGAVAGEIGPKELRGRTTKVQADAARVRADIARDAAQYVRANTVRHQADQSFAEILARYVPGSEQLGAGKPIDRAALSTEDQRVLDGWAEKLALSAEALLQAGLGGAAGLEAWRALGLSPGNRRAGLLLGYDPVDGKYMPKRYRAMRSRGLAPTRFGWLPEPLAQGERLGMAPEAGRWMQARAVDAAHATWDKRHVFSYTFIEVQTSAPHAGIVEWAGRVDETVGWMRSLFCRVPGYQEPVWPLLVNVYRTPEEAQANGDLPPEEMAYWQGHGVVTISSSGPRPTSVENAVQRAVASGLLEQAFPVNMSGGVYSGWMSEAFGKWAAFASADRPNNSGFLDHAGRDTELLAAEIRRGRNVFGELRSMQYADALASDLAGAAPLLAEFSFGDEMRWEGFARFAGRFAGYREEYADFDDLLSPAPEVSRAMKEWLDQRMGPGVNPGQPLTGQGTGNIRHEVTINNRFLAALGIDVAGLVSSLGDPVAVRVAEDAITAFVGARTMVGGPAAGVNSTLTRLPGKHEWTLVLAGPVAAVKSLLTDILWQAGVRLPPGAIPMPGGAPAPTVEGSIPPTRPNRPVRPHRPRDPAAGTPPLGSVPAVPAAPVEPGPQVIPVATAAWAKQSLAGINGVSDGDLEKIGQGKPSAVAALLALLKSGSDPARGAVAVILGSVGPVSPDVVPALAAALTDGVDENRRLVAQAFQKLGESAGESTPNLVARLGSDPDWVARQQIAIALQKMPEANLAAEMTGLINALEDKEKPVRDEVVKVLEKLSGKYSEARIALAVHSQREKVDVRKLLDDLLGGRD